MVKLVFTNDMNSYYVDENNNKWDTCYFTEDAEKAAVSLKNCKDCENCDSLYNKEDIFII